MTTIQADAMKYPIWNIKADFFLKIALIVLVSALVINLIIYAFVQIKKNNQI